MRGVRNGLSGCRRSRLLLLCCVAFLAACGGDGDDAPSSFALADDEPVVTVPVTIAATTTAAPTTTTSAPTTTTSTTTTIPPDPFRTWVATADETIPYLVAYDEPDGTQIPLEFMVPNPHQFGGPLTLMVTEGAPGDEWVRVQLPVRPNRQEGWIRTAGYEISGTRVRAEVDLTARTVVVYDGPDVIAETDAVIGSPATPTPLGTFSIAAKRENPPEESYLGPWALALSAFSEVHETFSGGIPVIAIHGTTRPDQVGQARSNGCIRIPNEVIDFLAEHVPLGAPVHISA